MLSWFGHTRVDALSVFGWRISWFTAIALACQFLLDLLLWVLAEYGVTE